MNDTRLYLSKVFIFEGRDKTKLHRTRKLAKTIEARLIGDHFIHLFNSDLLSLSCDVTHCITISSDSDTQLILFENVNGVLSPLKQKLQLKKCNKYRCRINAKCLVVATRNACSLTVELTTTTDCNALPPGFITKKTDEGTILVPSISSDELAKVVSALLSSSIELPLALLTPVSLGSGTSLRFNNLRYYLELNTAITITENVEEMYRYSPFSVKGGSGSLAELHYSVRMKTAAGDAAVVKVSCIESISNNAYSIIKSSSGEEVSASHTGRVATGSFIIPSGVMDVGLLFSTPYGFRGDLNDNPDTDLFHFDIFMLAIV